MGRSVPSLWPLFCHKKARLQHSSPPVLRQSGISFHTSSCFHVAGAFKFSRAQCMTELLRIITLSPRGDWDYNAKVAEARSYSAIFILMGREVEVMRRGMLAELRSRKDMTFQRRKMQMRISWRLVKGKGRQDWTEEERMYPSERVLWCCALCLCIAFPSTKNLKEYISFFFTYSFLIYSAIPFLSTSTKQESTWRLK